MESCMSYSAPLEFLLSFVKFPLPSHIRHEYNE